MQQGSFLFCWRCDILCTSGVVVDVVFVRNRRLSSRQTCTDHMLQVTVYCGKTADSIEMPFEMVGRVGPINDVLDEVRIPHGKGQICGEMGRRIVTYLYEECCISHAKTAEPIELSVDWG